MYYSLDREKAKEGIAVTTGNFTKKIDLKKYFGDNKNIWFVGDNPENHIVYIAETDTARNMTLKEKVEKGIITLKENEYIENGEIKQREEKLTELQCKELELQKIREQMKTIVDELERAKNYGLYTKYSLKDLETLKEKEFNLSVEIAMMMNN